MKSRWTLNRAGILNVYQYGDETIDLAGGRLLLRGVNGSGKSTAMNMLLPFLIEADVRRIDAAGEQTGVLRSWMLSGREEPNPVGYLWIEFERLDEQTGELLHLVCGCGIRASASTERVTTWWFVTDQRPGIDFSLLDRRTPLSVDALRSTIGSHAVFSHDRRVDYRTEVRARLFGGADLDQHIRLLHIVRSPRVGDRIDTDLPGYLLGALPQLSDDALADAAQPLEDLDEHRDNVDALRRTADALEGLSSVYESYARLELRDRAAQTDGLHSFVRAARREREAASKLADAAVRAAEEADARVVGLEAEESRFDAELLALRELPAYRDGMDLVNLRDLVASLARALTAADGDAAEFARRRVESARRVRAEHEGFDTAVSGLHSQLDEVAAVATAWRIAPAPPVPVVATVSETEPEVKELVVPIDAALDLDGLRNALTRVIIDAELRRSDIADVLAVIDDVARLEAAIRAAEAERIRRAAEALAAHDAADAARSARREAESGWRAAAVGWTLELRALERDGLDIPIVELTSAVGRLDLIDGLDDVLRVLIDAAQGVADHHRARAAELATEVRAVSEEVDRRRLIHVELLNATLPDPPAAPWQRVGRRRVLAEMIDFVADVPLDAQLGIEAAMEASGLLGAELLADGSIALETGEFVVAGRAAVRSPLSTFVAALPDDATRPADPHRLAVMAILDSITTDPTVDAETVISTTGEFRIGALRGRHTRALVEYIGVSNRRAALARRRAEAAAALADAEQSARSLEVDLDARRQHLARADAHGRALPTTGPLRKAVAVVDATEQVSDRAQVAAAEAETAVVQADAAHAERVTDWRRLAASHQLPFAREQLRSGDERLAGMIVECRSLSPRVTAVEQALVRWVSAVESWRRAIVDHLERTERTRARRAEHGEQQARLATLEDSLGSAWAEVVELIEASERERRTTRSALLAARSAAKSAVGDQSRTAEAARTSSTKLEEQEQRCAASLPGLIAALGVSGLVAAAMATVTGEAPPREGRPTVAAWPSVGQSADGARELATAITRTIPTPERGEVGADNVRSSLRQRRDSLGAGWDAEDHQPDAALPMAIVVTGPLGRMPLADASAEVSSQLRQQSSLLTAKQDQALRNLLQGVVATEVAEKLFAAGELVKLMNRRLGSVTTAHGIGASLRWRRRDDLEDDLSGTVDLLAKSPDHRSGEEDARLASALSARIDAARRDDPDATYRDLIARVLDYRSWHEMAVLVSRPGEAPRQLARHPRLSEGEKKVVSYLPLFAAVAASCDALAERSSTAPRFLLLDDAFAKVSEDNHGALFGLLVDLDLDFIATSERLWGTHASVPELSICEVVRDAAMSTILLEHARWNGTALARLEDGRR